MNQNSPKRLATGDIMPLVRLMDHVVQTHHVFCRQEVTRLSALLKEALDKHGKNHPELRRIQVLFSKMSKDLLMHLLKEEQTLFPYIARVEEAVAQNSPVSWPPFGTVENPIRMMVLEHDQTDDELKEISKLSNGYIPPADVGVGYTTLYDGLRAFEKDMQEHIHFENDLLFPRAIAMEEEACARRKQAGGET
jgi:regulator of cell morphogenesis and NO signaling